MVAFVSIVERREKLYLYQPEAAEERLDDEQSRNQDS